MVSISATPRATATISQMIQIGISAPEGKWGTRRVTTVTPPGYRRISGQPRFSRASRSGTMGDPSTQGRHHASYCAAFVQPRGVQPGTDRRDDRREPAAGRRPVRRPGGHGRRAVRPPVDLPAAGRGQRHARPRPAGGRDRRRERVGIWSPNCPEGAASVRHGQGGPDPGQHQPGLPHPRAGLRAAPGRHQGAGQRGELQDQRLPGDGRRGPRRPARPGRRDLPEHRGLGQAAGRRGGRGGRGRRRRRAGRAGRAGGRAGL